jgi:hypothetical protein
MHRPKRHIGLINWLRSHLIQRAAPSRVLDRDPAVIEIEATMAAVDQTMEDMPLITRPHAGPQVLMPLRVQRRGLDANYIKIAEPETYRELEATCEQCDTWRQCARDLAQSDADARLNKYCANTDILDRTLLKKS